MFMDILTFNFERTIINPKWSIMPLNEMPKHTNMAPHGQMHIVFLLLCPPSKKSGYIVLLMSVGLSLGQRSRSGGHMCSSTFLVATVLLK